MCNKNSTHFPCPACGFFSFDEPPGSYAICKLCGWEDDHVQLTYPEITIGANRQSLADAQKGAIKLFPLDVKEYKGIKRDPDWRLWKTEDRNAESQSPLSGLDYFEEATKASTGYYWRDYTYR